MKTDVRPITDTRNLLKRKWVQKRTGDQRESLWKRTKNETQRNATYVRKLTKYLKNLVDAARTRNFSGSVIPSGMGSLK